jgi:hypothetical protein
MIFQQGNNRRGQGWTVDIWTFLAQGCSADLAACYGSIAHLDECLEQPAGKR